jgi:hypothetical protein
MLQTFIKNKGTTKTIIHNNNRNEINEINWDADYNGDKANISIDMNENNGKTVKHYDIELDNENLAELLSIPSVNLPLEKRLIRDFQKTKKNIKPMLIEFDKNEEKNPTYSVPHNYIIIKKPKTAKHHKKKSRRHKKAIYKLIRRPRTYKHSKSYTTSSK